MNLWIKCNCLHPTNNNVCTLLYTVVNCRTLWTRLNLNGEHVKYCWWLHAPCKNCAKICKIVQNYATLCNIMHVVQGDGAKWCKVHMVQTECIKWCKNSDGVHLVQSYVAYMMLVRAGGWHQNFLSQTFRCKTLVQIGVHIVQNYGTNWCAYAKLWSKMQGTSWSWWLTPELLVSCC